MRRVSVRAIRALLGSAVATMTIASANVADAQTALSDYVVPLRGSKSTSGYSYGNFAPFAMRPYGFNMFTPATDANTGSWVYNYDQAGTNGIRGFLVSHQASVWGGDYGQIMVFPEHSSFNATQSSRGAVFTHANEESRPYYYKVTFNNGIITEIAPTVHAAKFQFTYPSGSTGNYLLFDTIDSVTGAVVTDATADTVKGYVDHQNSAYCPSGTCNRLYYYARLSTMNTGSTLSGFGVAARADFATGAQTVTMDLGTSFISVAQAQANVEDELGATITTKTFATAKAESKTAWTTTSARSRSRAPRPAS
jgi:putative alpha-1,2-mannosidase